MNFRTSIISTLLVFLLCQTVPAQEKTSVKSGRPHVTRFKTTPETRVFIPKGTLMAGGLIGYNSLQGENINFLILKNIDNLSGYTFRVAPYFGGFVADNFAIGGRLSYNRYMGNLGNLDLNLGADMNISLKDLYLISHKYDANVFGRYYIPFGSSRIVGMFAEMQLDYSRSQGKNTTGADDELDGTYQTGHSVGLYVNPGLCVFMCDFVAVEVGIGILGFDYGWKKSVTNQVESGYINTGGANFRINLLKINLGISFYF